jgi:hypothetical protein
MNKQWTKTKDGAGDTWDYYNFFVHGHFNTDGSPWFELNGWDGEVFTKEDIAQLIGILKDVYKEWPDDDQTEN